mgnify:CR=1 FL=1
MEDAGGCEQNGGTAVRHAICGAVARAHALGVVGPDGGASWGEMGPRPSDSEMRLSRLLQDASVSSGSALVAASGLPDAGDELTPCDPSGVILPVPPGASDEMPRPTLPSPRELELRLERIEPGRCRRGFVSVKPDARPCSSSTLAAFSFSIVARICCAATGDDLYSSSRSTGGPAGVGETDAGSGVGGKLIELRPEPHELPES